MKVVRQWNWNYSTYYECSAEQAVTRTGMTYAQEVGPSGPRLHVGSGDSPMHMMVYERGIHLVGDFHDPLPCEMEALSQPQESLEYINGADVDQWALEKWRTDESYQVYSVALLGESTLHLTNTVMVFLTDGNSRPQVCLWDELFNLSRDHCLWTMDSERGYWSGVNNPEVFLARANSEEE